jgi:hypothetical protein
MQTRIGGHVIPTQVRGGQGIYGRRLPPSAAAARASPLRAFSWAKIGKKTLHATECRKICNSAKHSRNQVIPVTRVDEHANEANGKNDEEAHPKPKPERLASSSGNETSNDGLHSTGDKHQ